MTTVSNIPREIQESIRDVVDRRIKLSIRRLVKQELRAEKFENKVLAFSACRLFILAARVPSKIEQTFHYLDFQAVESKKQNQLCITVEGKSYSFVTLEAETEEVDHMIAHIGFSLKQIFPSFPLERIIKKVEVIPPDRLRMMNDMMRDVDKKEPGPCGGYTTMYACMCDYHMLPYREEVAWDVDTIYLSQDSRELNLRDFDHLNGRDLVPIISALEHNIWFTKLNCSNIKLTSEAASEVIKVMKRNCVLEDLNLSNTGVKVDFVQKLTTAILSNSSSQLTKIDLSHNVIEDRGVIHLTGAISKLCKGLSYLDLTKTGLTGKGLNKLADTLQNTQLVQSTLKTLKLAENPVKQEDITNLYSFLAQPNAIETLDLSGTDCVLDTICGALLRGCCSNLKTLLLSRNTYTSKKMKDIVVPQTWKQFISNAMALEHLDLSSNKLPPEALKELLLGIIGNNSIRDLHLDISSNDLSTQGGHNLEACVGDIKNITSLDISNNNFDQEISSIMNCVAQNQSIKHLAIGRNFSGIKTKYLAGILDTVVHYIQEENSAVESLSIVDSKLKSDTAAIINAIGSNNTLTSIDLSGNHMGDYGARMLAKALQINTKIKTILWDRNGTSAQGFEDIAEALEKNYTVRKMPVPISDATSALRLHPERTEAALQKIESLLQRNHSPTKFASDQAYRLQQGFLISSTQQMVDRLVVQVQDTLTALSAGSGSEFTSDIEAAKSVVKDADNSKQLLPRLQVLAHKQGENNLVQSFLKQMSDNLKETVEKQIKRNTDEMLKCAKEQCAAILADKNVLSDLENGCSEKSSLPKNYTSIVLEDVATDIHNKLSEIDLAVAAHLSDRVVDEVIESLSKHHKVLTNHLNLTKSGQFKDNRKDEKTEKNESNAEKELRAKSDEKSKSPARCYSMMDDPTTSPSLSRKKDTLHKRKYRPQSTIDREQVQVALSQRASSLDSASANHIERAKDRKFMTEKMCETLYESKNVILKSAGVTIKIHKPIEDLKIFEDPSKTDAPVSLDEIDSVLVVENMQKLEHVTKSRPKRARAHAPTRPTPPRTSEMNGPTDQTADTFFGSTPVVKEHVASSNGNSSPSLARQDKHPNDDVQKSEKKKGWFSKDKKKEEKPIISPKPYVASKPTSGFSNRLPNFLRTRKSTDKKELEVEDTRIADNKTPSPKLDKKLDDKKSPIHKEEEKDHTSPKVEDRHVPISSILEEEGVDLDSGKKSEDEVEDDAPKEIIPKKPVGIRMPGMGMGGNVLEEMKAKRLSRVPKPERESNNNDPTPVVLPVHKLKHVPRTEESKKDENKKEPEKSSSSAKDRPPSKPVSKTDESKKNENKKEAEKLSASAKDKVPIKPASKTEESRSEGEKVNLSGSAKDKPSVKTEESKKDDNKTDEKENLSSSAKNRLSFGLENGHPQSSESKPKAAPRSAMKPPTSKRVSEVLTKPPPPTRPKPAPPTKPKPGARNSMCEKQETDEAEHEETSPKAPDSEIVYDSATLRMSVKQKIKKMGLTDSEKDKKSECPTLPELFENSKSATTPTSPSAVENPDEMDGSPSPRISTEHTLKDSVLNLDTEAEAAKSPALSEKRLSGLSNDRSSVKSDDTSIKVSKLSESEHDPSAEIDGGDEKIKVKKLSTSVKSASDDAENNSENVSKNQDDSVSSPGGSNPEEVVFI